LHGEAPEEILVAGVFADIAMSLNALASLRSISDTARRP
jgi:hypothetical protein